MSTLTASYQIAGTWSSGYQVTVTVKNPTAQVTTAWSTQFQLPPGQTIASSWSCNLTTTGSTYIASNPGWNGGGTIPAGGSISFGMIVANPNNTTNQLLNLTATGTFPLPTPT